jgi:pimeloyl-ACP methyl ester carboxylesterase
MPGKKSLQWWMLCAVLNCSNWIAAAQAQTVGPHLRKPRELATKLNANFEWPTLGGNQYWSDVKILDGWKLQRHATTGHYRLIDNHDIRQAWGTLEQCQHALANRKHRNPAYQDSGKVVILLHGLLRSSDSMERMGDYLQTQGNYRIVNFAYASARAPIETHSADLKSVIEGLGTEVTEINFVAHSMGNIVVRHYLKQHETCRQKPSAPFGRMVMLAPPNQGSQAARNLAKSTRLFAKLAGPSGLQLGTQWEELAPHLTTPPFEFGIIIGAKDEEDEMEPQNDHAMNLFDLNEKLADIANTKFVPHDFTVSVGEAKLAGSADFLVGPFFHWDIKYHPQAVQQTLHFLKHGRFENSQLEPATEKIPGATWFPTK